MRQATLSTVLLLLLSGMLLSGPAAATPCPTELPILFIIQDKSGTMADVPDANGCPTCPSKWNSAKTVVPELVSSFSSRFRFGFEMYPRDSTKFNCTQGTVLSPVPASAAQIYNQYQSKAPGGGTPTAVSLEVAHTYLTGLNSAAPKHVLLITDGLPNCNLALDDRTCATTTDGCQNRNSCSGKSCCGLGPKDCLDDTESMRAAKALSDAGIKVYVVGFGSGAVGNNQAVLNNIADQGGTGSAYAVTDQAGLRTVLDTIGAQLSNCCNDACLRGASRCSAAGKLESCLMDEQLGCTSWTTTDCGPRSQCVSGQCQPCSDACTLGVNQCLGRLGQRCDVGPIGCSVWNNVAECGYGEYCSNATCLSCQACRVGEKRCDGVNAEECTLDLLTGCTSWHPHRCAPGTMCVAGLCTNCTGACTTGSQRCSGITPESCLADGQGCTSWNAGTPCTDYCSGGSCGTCGPPCPANETRCNGAQVESCQSDEHGCYAWAESRACVGGVDYCDAGQCHECPTHCELGQRRCAEAGTGVGIEECRTAASGTGCLEFAKTADCLPGETCEAGACVPPCSDECSASQSRCTDQGQLVTCSQAATGCGVWNSAVNCPDEQQCAADACRTPCAFTEVDLCEPGTICTGLPEGTLCMPDPNWRPDSVDPTGADAGTPADDAGSIERFADGGDALSAARVTSRNIQVSSGKDCGCQATDLVGLSPLGLVLLGLSRRRERRRATRHR